MDFTTEREEQSSQRIQVKDQLQPLSVTTFGNTKKRMKMIIAKE